MPIPRRPLERIHPLLRPLRPPSRLPRPRQFTHNSQLLLIVSPHGPRPQLPFLHLRSRSVRQPLKIQWQINFSRGLTTERRHWIKDQLILGGKFGLYGATIFALIMVAMFGVHQELLERRFPSPDDWGFRTRMAYRQARSTEDSWIAGDDEPDYAMMAGCALSVLRRLEDPAIEGKDLQEQGDGGIMVEGIGKMGYDISAKSDMWKDGYFNNLMTCAKAAEHLDGWVVDKTDSKRTAFPPNVVIGPSNPNPRPLPPGATVKAPLEENCSPAFPEPAAFYLKALTTTGLPTGHRLDAALAYASYLDFKGLHSSAEEMYNWALDIAQSTSSTTSPLSPTRGVIPEHSHPISANLLRATTALGVHHARTGSPDLALPILLSALRAQAAAPTASLDYSTSSSNDEPAKTDIGAFVNLLRQFILLFKAHEYPGPPPSGDELYMRGPATACDDAALMAYIGEILFATAPGDASAEREQGIDWTREAVRKAEHALGTLQEREGREVKAAGEKCRGCLKTAVGNWGVMVRAMVEEEREAKMREGSKKSWFSGAKKEELESGRWEAEEKEARRKIESIRSDLLQEAWAEKGRNSSLAAI